MPQETPIHFNRIAFIARCGGDMKIANKMLRLSKPTFAGYIIKLNHYIEQKNFIAAKSVAHTIKGAAMQMNFEIMAEKAIKINTMQEPDFEQIQSLAHEISDEYSTIMAAVKHFVNN